jgi:Flp pilus assembly protein TadG
MVRRGKIHEKLKGADVVGLASRSRGSRYLKKNVPATQRCRGVPTVESAIVLSVLLVLLLGMLELSVALVRYTVVSESARRIARAAIVHGANTQQGVWGPATVNTDAGTDHPAASAVRSVLMTIDPSDVQINLQWPDGTNEPDQRIRVTVHYTHLPVVPIPWYGQIQLQAVSTMRIAH